MPVKSKKQWRFMQLLRNNPKLAKKKGISSKMAEEFIKATPKGAVKKLPEKK